MRKFTKLETFLNISGICLIASIFKMNSVILTACLTLFVVAIMLNISKTFGKDILFKLEEQTDKKAEEYIKNGKRFAGVINYTVFPMVMVGLFLAAIQLVIMWVGVL